MERNPSQRDLYSAAASLHVATVAFDRAIKSGDIKKVEEAYAVHGAAALIVHRNNGATLLDLAVHINHAPIVTLLLHYLEPSISSATLPLLLRAAIKLNLSASVDRLLRLAQEIFYDDVPRVLITPRPISIQSSGPRR